MFEFASLHPESGPKDKFCGICLLVAGQIDTILENPKVAKAIITAVEAQLCNPLVGHFKNKVSISARMDEFVPLVVDAQFCGTLKL